MQATHGAPNEALSTLPPKTRLNDVAAIGPLVRLPAYPGVKADDHIWSAALAVSVDTAQGPQFHSTMLELGRDGLTGEESRDVYDDLVDELHKRFCGVLVFADALDVLRFDAERWPMFEAALESASEAA